MISVKIREVWRLTVKDLEHMANIFRSIYRIFKPCTHILNECIRYIYWTNAFIHLKWAHVDGMAKANEQWRMPSFTFGNIPSDVGNWANVKGCLFGTNDLFTWVRQVGTLDNRSHLVTFPRMPVIERMSKDVYSAPMTYLLVFAMYGRWTIFNAPIRQTPNLLTNVSSVYVYGALHIIWANVKGCLFGTNDLFTRIRHVWMLDNF